jgi:glycosyltransferase involved in cell wall biosynthesis
LNQTYTHTEILVINDGSTDGGETERIALSYGDRIRYFSKENGGVSSALNVGIREMKGEYFSWLSHDDLYLPEKVERQVEQVIRYPDATVMSVCEAGLINAGSECIRSSVRLPLPKDTLIPAKDALLHFIRIGGFNGCALLIPKRILDACGGFAEDLRYCQDYLMWMNIFMHDCDLVYAPLEGVRMRVHEQQFTNRGKALYAKESYAVCERVLPYLLEHSTRENNYLYTFAYDTGVHGNKSSVRLCLRDGRARGVLTASQRLKLRWVMLYGDIRPFLRKVYYRVFKGVRV